MAVRGKRERQKRHHSRFLGKRLAKLREGSRHTAVELRRKDLVVESYTRHGSPGGFDPGHTGVRHPRQERCAGRSASIFGSHVLSVVLPMIGGPATALPPLPEAVSPD